MYQPGSIRTLKKLSEAQHSTMSYNAALDQEPDDSSPSSSDVSSSCDDQFKPSFEFDNVQLDE